MTGKIAKVLYMAVYIPSCLVLLALLIVVGTFSLPFWVLDQGWKWVKKNADVESVTWPD